MGRAAFPSTGGRSWRLEATWSPPQRFAIDWFQLKTADSRFTGDSKNNRNYRAYGADVVAVADATVARIKDGIPDNTPGEDPSAAF